VPSGYPHHYPKVQPDPGTCVLHPSGEQHIRKIRTLGRSRKQLSPLDEDPRFDDQGSTAGVQRKSHGIVVPGSIRREARDMPQHPDRPIFQQHRLVDATHSSGSNSPRSGAWEIVSGTASNEGATVNPICPGPHCALRTGEHRHTSLRQRAKPDILHSFRTENQLQRGDRPTNQKVFRHPSTVPDGEKSTWTPPNTSFSPIRHQNGSCNRKAGRSSAPSNCHPFAWQETERGNLRSNEAPRGPATDIFPRLATDGRDCTHPHHPPLHVHPLDGGDLRGCTVGGKQRSDAVRHSARLPYTNESMISEAKGGHHRHSCLLRRSTSPPRHLQSMPRREKRCWRRIHCAHRVLPLEDGLWSTGQHALGSVYPTATPNPVVLLLIHPWYSTSQPASTSIGCAPPDLPHLPRLSGTASGKMLVATPVDQVER
jgi:hypothetical protein